MGFFDLFRTAKKEEKKTIVVDGAKTEASLGKILVQGHAEHWDQGNLSYLRTGYSDTRGGGIPKAEQADRPFTHAKRHHHSEETSTWLTTVDQPNIRVNYN